MVLIEAMQRQDDTKAAILLGTVEQAEYRKSIFSNAKLISAHVQTSVFNITFKKQSYTTYRRTVQEVEVHIIASSTCVCNSTRKLQLFAVPAQWPVYNLGPFPAQCRYSQDTDIIITTSIVLLRKDIGTCVCTFSRCECIMYTKNVHSWHANQHTSFKQCRQHLSLCELA